MNDDTKYFWVVDPEAMQWGAIKTTSVDGNPHHRTVVESLGNVDIRPDTQWVPAENMEDALSQVERWVYHRVSKLNNHVTILGHQWGEVRLARQRQRWIKWREEQRSSSNEASN